MDIKCLTNLWKFGAASRALGEDPAGRTIILENETSKERKKNHHTQTHFSEWTRAWMHGEAARSDEPAVHRWSETKV